MKANDFGINGSLSHQRPRSASLDLSVVLMNDVGYVLMGTALLLCDIPKRLAKSTSGQYLLDINVEVYTMAGSSNTPS